MIGLAKDFFRRRVAFVGWSITDPAIDATVRKIGRYPSYPRAKPKGSMQH